MAENRVQHSLKSLFPLLCRCGFLWCLCLKTTKLHKFLISIINCRSNNDLNFTDVLLKAQYSRQLLDFFHRNIVLIMQSDAQSSGTMGNTCNIVFSAN